MPKTNMNLRKISETFTFPAPIIEKNKAVSESASGNENEYIVPKIEAIHAGATRNYTYYPAAELKGDPIKKTGVYSWTQPYPKPVIYNHDHETEATGRVQKAVYTEETQVGKPGIILYPKISSKEAIEAIKDGRLLTVSIGGECSSLVCSICHTDIIQEGLCNHYKGEIYDNETCYWIVKDLKFDEVSWVNVPADEEAMVTEVETSPYFIPEENLSENTGTQLQESDDNNEPTEIIVESVESSEQAEELEIETPTENEEVSKTEEGRTIDIKDLKQIALMVSEMMKAETKEVEEPTVDVEDAPLVSEEANEGEQLSTDEESVDETIEENNEPPSETHTAEQSEEDKTIDELSEAFANLNKKYRELLISCLLIKESALSTDELSELITEELENKYFDMINAVDVTEDKEEETDSTSEVTERKVETIQNPILKVKEKTEEENEIAETISETDKVNFLISLLK